METKPLYVACTRRAAAMLGSYEKLGACMGVPPRRLERWAEGVDAPSQNEFLQLVDIVLDTRLEPARRHSHSMVAGGLEEMS